MTDDRKQQTYRSAFWLLLAAATVFRLFIAGRFGLGVDEAHYVLYARHPAWGYFDHPPMVAFLVGLTNLLGTSAFYVRLGPILCSAGSVILVRLLALALYRDERVAFWSLALLLLMPIHHLLAVALLPDDALNLFWCGALVTAWLAMRDGKWSLWLLTGVLFGGALLSKYHAVLLPACLLCYVVFSPSQRHWLRRPHPYVAGLVGLLVFMPNIVWNAQHDWISYAFQLAHGRRGGGAISLSKLAETFGGQMGVASPVIFGLLVAAFVAMARERFARDSDRFLFCTSFPVFLFFCGMGLTGKILPHWPFIGWWTGSLAIVAVVMRKVEAGGGAAKRWRRWSAAGAVVGALCILLMYAAILTPVIEPVYNWAYRTSLRLHAWNPAIREMDPFDSSVDITNDLYGWNLIAAKVQEMRAGMPNPIRTFVFCHRSYENGLLAVNLDPKTVSTTLNRKPTQYLLWFHPPDYVGWDALFVDDREVGPEAYAGLFESVDPVPVKMQVFRRGHVSHAVRIYRCFGFKGSI